jgi:hypothetical protein
VKILPDLDAGLTTARVRVLEVIADLNLPSRRALYSHLLSQTF